MIFQNRKEAGRLLAGRLKKEKFETPYVFGIARGGIVVAAEIAETLNAPLDIVVCRKLGFPGQPELGFGAIAPGGITVLNNSLIESAGIKEDTIRLVHASEKNDLERRLRRYRNNSSYQELIGKDVVLVDDGIATGITVKAAIKFIKNLTPRSLIVASPVCASDTALEIQALVKKTVILNVPEEFYAVGQFYIDFPQTTDKEVISLLKMYNKS